MFLLSYLLFLPALILAFFAILLTIFLTALPTALGLLFDPFGLPGLPAALGLFFDPLGLPRLAPLALAACLGGFPLSLSPSPLSLRAAWAAASRAMGTRNGEQET